MITILYSITKAVLGMQIGKVSSINEKKKIRLLYLRLIDQQTW